MKASRTCRGLLMAASICASGVAAMIRIPLQQNEGEVNPFQHAAYAISKYGIRASSSSPLPVEPETLDGGFWYGLFEVGDAKNLSLIIDTASSAVGINPMRYKPSPASKNLHMSGLYRYLTTMEDGCGESNFSYNVFSDQASNGDFNVKQQHFYSIEKKPQTTPGIITKLPHDGVIGFAGNTTTGPGIIGLPWFAQLCSEGEVDECRFGLAYGTQGKGEQVFGGIETDLFEGELSRAPVSGHQWYLQGSVISNGEALFKNKTIVLDSGTAGIIGPNAEVLELFKSLGIQAVTHNSPGCQPGVFGYYPCDSPPPSMGFQFGQGHPIFNVAPSGIKLRDNGNNNCTAFITGIDIEGQWIAGQNWFQTKYVDFDLTEGTVGVAHLKNPTGAGC